METTYRVGDGVEIRLLNDRVVHAPDLSVAEARNVLRTLVGIAEDPASHAAQHTEFVRAFPERILIADERLVDVGFRFEAADGDEIDFGDLTVSDALDMVAVLGDAMGDPYALDTATAQVRVLDEFPVTLGLPPDMRADAVFALARGLTEALYRMIYGLAADFSAALTASPPVRTVWVRAMKEPAKPQRLNGWKPRSSTPKSNTRRRSVIGWMPRRSGN